MHALLQVVPAAPDALDFRLLSGKVNALGFLTCVLRASTVSEVCSTMDGNSRGHPSAQSGKPCSPVDLADSLAPQSHHGASLGAQLLQLKRCILRFDLLLSPEAMFMKHLRSGEVLPLQQEQAVPEDPILPRRA